MKVFWGHVSAEHDDARVAWEGLYDTLEAQWTADDDVSFAFDRPSLDRLKALALAHLDERVAGLRAVYIARIPGQEAAYQTKLDQAREYTALPTAQKVTADPTAYPALYGEEPKEREVSPAQMAALIMQAARRWATASDRIDAVYLRARTAIDNSRDVSGVLAVLRAIPHTL